MRINPRTSYVVFKEIGRYLGAWLTIEEEFKDTIETLTIYPDGNVGLKVNSQAQEKRVKELLTRIKEEGIHLEFYNICFY